MISKTTIVTLLREAAAIADRHARLLRSLDRERSAVITFDHAATMRRAADDLEKTGVGPS